MCFPLIVCCCQYFCFYLADYLFSEFGICACFSPCVKCRPTRKSLGLTEFQRVRTLCQRMYKFLRCHARPGLRCIDIRGQLESQGSFHAVSEYGILSTHIYVFVGKLSLIYIIHSWNDITTVLLRIRKYPPVIKLILPGTLTVGLIANIPAGT